MLLRLNSWSGEIDLHKGNITMLKINAFFLVLLTSMTAYLVVQYQNPLGRDQREILSSGSASYMKEVNGIEQQLNDVRHQLGVIQQQLTELNVNDDRSSVSADNNDMNQEGRTELRDLMNEVLNIQLQLTEIDAGINPAPVVSDDKNAIYEDRSEENEAGNDLIDGFIVNGRVDGNDMIRMHKHFSHMDFQEQQRALQRLVMAINEQRVEIDLNELP